MCARALRVHVGADVNLVREFRDLDLKATLDLGEDGGVALGADETDSKALGAEAAGAADAVEVRVGELGDVGLLVVVVLLFAGRGEVVVDDDVHALDVDAAGQDVRAHLQTGADRCVCVVCGYGVWVWVGRRGERGRE